MIWKSSLSNQQNEVYELWHNDEKLLRLEYHPFTNSARIEYEDTRRVFILRREGLLRNKTVLRNEYGIRIGQLGYEKNGEGTIELNEDRFSFTLGNDPQSRLVIRADKEGETELVCGLTTQNGTPSVQWRKKAHHVEQFLLLALCWYLYLPVAKEKRVMETA